MMVGTNRGLMEINRVNDEAVTVKTWYLYAPISKVILIGPTDFLCLDFASQRLVIIST